MEKILLVEDEARIRNIVLDYFTAHGLSCDLARNGEEALDILRDNDYDAILLDILMPGLDGFAVCQSVRKKSNVPIMFLTALGSEEDTLKGYALGLNEARFSNIFIEKRASSCQQSLEKSRLFSYPLLMSEGENSQNVKRIFLRKVVI